MKKMVREMKKYSCMSESQAQVSSMKAFFWQEFDERQSGGKVGTNCGAFAKSVCAFILLCFLAVLNVYKCGGCSAVAHWHSGMACEYSC